MSGESSLELLPSDLDDSLVGGHGSSLYESSLGIITDLSDRLGSFLQDTSLGHSSLEIIADLSDRLGSFLQDSSGAETSLGIVNNLDDSLIDARNQLQGASGAENSLGVLEKLDDSLKEALTKLSPAGHPTASKAETKLSPAGHPTASKAEDDDAFYQQLIAEWNEPGIIFSEEAYLPKSPPAGPSIGPSPDEEDAFYQQLIAEWNEPGIIFPEEAYLPKSPPGPSIAQVPDGGPYQSPPYHQPVTSPQFVQSPPFFSTPTESPTPKHAHTAYEIPSPTQGDYSIPSDFFPSLQGDPYWRPPYYQPDTSPQYIQPPVDYSIPYGSFTPEHYQAPDETHYDSQADYSIPSGFFPSPQGDPYQRPPYYLPDTSPQYIQTPAYSSVSPGSFTPVHRQAAVEGPSRAQEWSPPDEYVPVSPPADYFPDLGIGFFPWDQEEIQEYYLEKRRNVHSQRPPVSKQKFVDFGRRRHRLSPIKEAYTQGALGSIPPLQRPVSPQQAAQQLPRYVPVPQNFATSTPLPVPSTSGRQTLPQHHISLPNPQSPIKSPPSLPSLSISVRHTSPQRSTFIQTPQRTVTSPPSLPLPLPSTSGRPTSPQRPRHGPTLQRPDPSTVVGVVSKESVAVSVGKFEALLRRLEQGDRGELPTVTSPPKKVGLRPGEVDEETLTAKEISALLCRYGTLGRPPRTASTYRPPPEEPLPERPRPPPRVPIVTYGPHLPWVAGSFRYPPKTAAGRIASPAGAPLPKPVKPTKKIVGRPLPGHPLVWSDVSSAGSRPKTPHRTPPTPQATPPTPQATPPTPTQVTPVARPVPHRGARIQGRGKSVPAQRQASVQNRQAPPRANRAPAPRQSARTQTRTGPPQPIIVPDYGSSRPPPRTSAMARLSPRPGTPMRYSSDPPPDPSRNEFRSPEMIQLERSILDTENRLRRLEVAVLGPIEFEPVLGAITPPHLIEMEFESDLQPVPQPGEFEFEPDLLALTSPEGKERLKQSFSKMKSAVSRLQDLADRKTGERSFQSTPIDRHVRFQTRLDHYSI